MPPFFVDGLPIGLLLNQLANYCLLRRPVKGVPFNFRRVILIWT